VSQTIVRRHRGTLVGENVPDWEGGGARFVVALPFLERRKIDRDLLEDELETDVATAGGGRRILLIEDDSAVRLSVRRYLERLGWLVEEASDGAAALPGDVRALGRGHCDLRMPGKSGIEISIRSPGPPRSSRAIRADLRRRGCAEVRASRAHGMVILEKPFELSILAAVGAQQTGPRGRRWVMPWGS
jgi:CheY-like chemotaxis protein